MLAVAEEVPKTEVPAKATRRRYSAQYKLRILREAAACTQSGAIAALLRREGLYSSHLTAWRHAQERGELDALTPKKRGPKSQAPDARDREIAELRKKVARLEKRAERAEAICEVQKKVAALIGMELDTLPPEKP